MIQKKGIAIVINSSNRPNEIKTTTAIESCGLDYYIAIPTEQYEQYKHLNVPLCLIPQGIEQCLPDQRHWVMEYFHDKYKYIWLMDDDLTFFKRTEEGKLVKCTESDIQQMTTTMLEQLQNYNMVGISTRLGNNRVTEDYQDICRVTRCYALSTETYAKVGAVFNPIPKMTAEDFHLALCWLNAGEPNRVIYTYAQEDIGSNAKGGCSIYRTYDVHRRTSIWMTQNHPEVAIKAKSTKAAWGLKEANDGTSTRVDMTIQWKKAYKPKKVQGTAKSSFFKRNV